MIIHWYVGYIYTRAGVWQKLGNKQPEEPSRAKSKLRAVIAFLYHANGVGVALEKVGWKHEPRRLVILPSAIPPAFPSSLSAILPAFTVPPVTPVIPMRRWFDLFTVAFYYRAGILIAVALVHRPRVDIVVIRLQPIKEASKFCIRSSFQYYLQSPLRR